MGKRRRLRESTFFILLAILTGSMLSACFDVCDTEGVTSPNDLVAMSNVIAVGTLVSCDTVRIYSELRFAPKRFESHEPRLRVYSLHFEVDQWLTPDLDSDQLFIWFTQYVTFSDSIPAPMKHGLHIGGQALLYGCTFADSQMARLHTSACRCSMANIDNFNANPKLFAPHFDKEAVEAFELLQNSPDLKLEFEDFSVRGTVITPTDDLSVMTYFCWEVGMHWHEGDSRQECREGSSSEYVKEIAGILKQTAE